MYRYMYRYMYRRVTIHYNYSEFGVFCWQKALNRLIMNLVSACSDVRNKLFLRQEQSVSPKETKCFRLWDKWKQMLEMLKLCLFGGKKAKPRNM